MRRLFIFLLTTFLIATLIVINTSCGKTGGEKGGTNSNSNTGDFYITTWFPSTGETGVASTETINLIFNNSIDVSKFDNSLLIFASDHSAGTPSGGLAGATYSWTSENKILTISGLTWPSVETTNDPPITVHILNNGAFEDTDGNLLPFGTVIASYEIATNLSRYFPTALNTTWGYLFNSFQNPGITYQARSIISGTYGQYKNIIIYDYSPTPSENSQTVSAYSTDSNIYSNPFYFVVPDFSGVIIMDNSNGNGIPVIGSSWTSSTTIGSDPWTFEAEVLLKETILVPYINCPAFKTRIKYTSTAFIDPNSFGSFDVWYAYNLGPIKIEVATGEGTTITQFVATMELMNYSKP